MHKKVQAYIEARVKEAGGRVLKNPETGDIYPWITKGTCHHLDISRTFCEVKVQSYLPIKKNGKIVRFKIISKKVVPWNKTIVDTNQEIGKSVDSLVFGFRGSPDEDHPFLPNNIVGFREKMLVEQDLIDLKASLIAGGKVKDALAMPDAPFFIAEGSNKCMVQVGKDGRWVGCKFHPYYHAVQKAAKVKGFKEKANILWPYYYRPSKRGGGGYKLPPSAAGWSEEDIDRYWARVYTIAEALMHKKGYDFKEAWRKAKWVLCKDYPDAKELTDKSFGVPRKIQHDFIRKEVHDSLKKAGINVPLKDVFYIYRWLVDRDENGHVVPSMLSGCPLTTEVPDGYRSVYTILGFATARNGLVIDKNTEFDGWIRCGGVDEDAKKFNRRRESTRKKLLCAGCERDCVQELLFEVRTIDGKKRVTPRPETLLYPEAFGAVVDMFAYNEHHLTAQDEEDFHEAVRYELLAHVDEPPIKDLSMSSDEKLRLFAEWKAKLTTHEEWEHFMSVYQEWLEKSGKEPLYHSGFNTRLYTLMEQARRRLAEEQVAGELPKEKVVLTPGTALGVVLTKDMCPAILLAERLFPLPKEELCPMEDRLTYHERYLRQKRQEEFIKNDPWLNRNK